MVNVKNLEEDIFSYAKKNLAVVNVYIKDPVVTRIMKDQVCITRMIFFNRSNIFFLNHRKFL